MRILITGCRGFLGGSVGRHAARAGHEVLGVGRAAQGPPAWPGAYAAADVVSADLSGLVRDFRPDAVLHAAGTASVADSLRAPLDDLRASLLSWANALDAVRRAGSRAVVIFPSSAAVYGELGETDEAADEETPARPVSPYGFHKAACELVAREYAECFGLRVVSCRLFSLFGPAQRRLLVWELYRQCVAPGGAVWLEGTGEETRDYLHVEDASAALVALMKTDGGGREAEAARVGERRAGSHAVVNVASGVETRVADLAAMVRDMVAPGKEIECRGQARAGDPRRWRADTSRLRSLAPAWTPRPLRESLAECVAAWQVETS